MTFAYRCAFQTDNFWTTVGRLPFFAPLLLFFSAWRSSGCLVVLQIPHFTFSLHSLAMWFGEKKRKHNLSSLTHCSLFLTIILLKALHSVSSWPVRFEINSASMSGVLGFSFLAFCRYRVLYWSSAAAWPRNQVGTGASFDSPRNDDFVHAICCTDSRRNVRVISLSRFVLDHRWEFAECRIGLVVFTWVAYYFLLPFRSEHGGDRAFA